MIKSLLSAGLFAGFLISAGPATSAHAVPLPRIDALQSTGSESVILVRGGRGGGGGGFAMRSAGPRASGFVGGGRSFAGNQSGGFKHLGHSGKHHGHSGKHHGRRGFVYFGVPAYYGYSNYYAADECAWLYRKAVRTGSRHWWNRYRECRDD